MMLICYTSKKALKECVGQPLNYRETSAFGPEYKDNGTFCAAYRPALWPHPEKKGREFFAQITMVDGLIQSVK